MISFCLHHWPVLWPRDNHSIMCSGDQVTRWSVSTVSSLRVMRSSSMSSVSPASSVTVRPGLCPPPRPRNPRPRAPVLVASQTRPPSHLVTVYIFRKASGNIHWLNFIDSLLYFRINLSNRRWSNLIDVKCFSIVLRYASKAFYWILHF